MSDARLGSACSSGCSGCGSLNGHAVTTSVCKSYKAFSAWMVWYDKLDIIIHQLQVVKCWLHPALLDQVIRGRIGKLRKLNLTAGQ